MAAILHFDQGIPIYDGRPELLEEYLDRIATLEIQYTDEVQKKQGPLAPRMYNALRGDAYMAVKAANIDKQRLATDVSVSSRLGSAKNARLTDGDSRCQKNSSGAVQLIDIRHRTMIYN